MTEQQKDEFEQLAYSLIEWMYKNCHPHMTAIITPTSAELLEGQMSVVSRPL